MIECLRATWWWFWRVLCGRWLSCAIWWWLWSLFVGWQPPRDGTLRDLLTAIEWSRGLGYTDAELAVAQEQVSSNMSDEDHEI
jgi:hypothetical protein